MKWNDKAKRYVLSTERSVWPWNADSLAIGADADVYFSVFNGVGDFVGYDEVLTPRERAEVAEHAVALWKKWGEIDGPDFDNPLFDVTEVAVGKGVRREHIYVQVGLDPDDQTRWRTFSLQRGLKDFHTFGKTKKEALEGAKKKLREMFGEPEER